MVEEAPGSIVIATTTLNDLLFGRRRRTYVAFDLLIPDGIDLRSLPLRDHKAMLARIGAGAESWIALTNGVVGDGASILDDIWSARYLQGIG